MANSTVITNNHVGEVFESYPKQVRPNLLHLRKLILEVAKENNINDLEEVLRWGQPSYVCKTGSTVRLGLVKNEPGSYALFFQCTSSLVDTFRQVYGKKFSYEGNRALIFNTAQKLPEKELKECIYAALNYHRLKKLPLLGLAK